MSLCERVLRKQREYVPRYAPDIRFYWSVTKHGQLVFLIGRLALTGYDVVHGRGEGPPSLAVANRYGRA